MSCKKIRSVWWHYFSLRVLRSPSPTSVYTRQSLLPEQIVIYPYQSTHQVIKSTIYAPVFKSLKTVREVQGILNQLRAFQLPDKILGTGKSRLLGHHLVQRPQTCQWCYRVCLTASRTNWGHPPLPPPWLQVPQYKNILLYPVKNPKKYFSVLNGQTIYQHLHCWLAPSPHCLASWPSNTRTTDPRLTQALMSCNTIPTAAATQAGHECLWIFSAIVSTSSRKAKRQAIPCQW